MTKIITKNSQTTSSVPLASDLEVGEVAVNTADKRLFTKHSDNSIAELGTSPSTLNVGGTLTIPTYVVHADDTDTFFGFAGLNTFNVNTNGSERLRINDAGNVGIGTTTPSTKLEVSGDITITDASTVLQMSANAGSFNAVNFGDNVADFVGQILYNHANDAMTFTANGSERMRIDDTGNVGIGTTTPSTDLHVGNASTSAPAITIQSSTSGFTTINMGDTDIDAGRILYDNNTDSMRFSTNANERIRIDSNGDVGIGTANPQRLLHVVSRIATDTVPLRLQSGSTATENFIDIKDSTTTADFKVLIGSKGDDLSMWAGGSERIRVDSGGNVGIGTTSPNQKLEVSGSGTQRIRLSENGTGNYLQFAVATSGTALTAFGSGTDNIQFITGVSERMRIDASGNVGIGTTSPTADLSVGSTSTTTGSLALRTTRTTFDITPSNSDGGGVLFDLGWAVGGQGSFRWATSGTERMRITSTGNVGIGTTTLLNAKVTVDGGATNEVFQIDADGAPYATWSINNTDFGFVGSATALTAGSATDMAVRSNANLIFASGASGTERMRIDSLGNVLIGRTADNEAVAGITLQQDGLMQATRAGDALSLRRTGSDGAIATFRRDGTVVGTIAVTTTATAYNTSSDERLKENITDAPSASGDIDAVQVRQFDWKADGSHQKYGVIAQELKKVASYAVTTPESEDDMMAVDYSKLVPMMLKEIQELRKRVAELEK